MSTTEQSSPPQATNAAPLVQLSYADLPARWGIVCQQIPGGLRLIIPPVPSWRHLGARYFISASIVAILLSDAVWRTSHARRSPDVFGLVVTGFALFMILLLAVHRLTRRICIVIDDRHVTVTTHFLRSAVRRWPRSAVGEISMNRSNGSLHFRITGKDRVDIFATPSREITEWIAGVLNDALQARPAPASDAASEPVETSGVRSRSVRSALLVVGSIMLLASIAMMFCGLPWMMPGVFLLILSGVPFGIALGIQDKDFYFT
jgi:hypothetical protein